MPTWQLILFNPFVLACIIACIVLMVCGWIEESHYKRQRDNENEDD